MDRQGSITVLLADDHPMLRASLVRAIQHQPSLRLVGEAADGRAALQSIRELGPDVAVIDLRMPGLDGLAVLNAARRDGLSTRIMLLSGLLERSDVERALDLGAAGVLSKTTEATALVDAILAVGRGETVMGSDVPQPQGGPGGRPRAAPLLTPREHEILHLMAAGRSGPQIAQDLVLSLSTVKTHTEKLYTKLGVSDRGAAVAEGMRRGLVE